MAFSITHEGRSHYPHTLSSLFVSLVALINVFVSTSAYCDFSSKLKGSNFLSFLPIDLQCLDQ